MLNKAIEFALKAHTGMFRKGTKIPYILHPMEAATIVGRIKNNESLIIAALLHDTIEDTDTTYSDIEKFFGKSIADLVNSESEDKSKSWKERKSHTLNTLKDESTDVKIVAMGDKLSNIRSIAKDYAEIGDRLWERFNVKDKKEQGWYYKGLVECLEELNYTNEWKELKYLTEKVFN